MSEKDKVRSREIPEDLLGRFSLPTMYSQIGLPDVTSYKGTLMNNVDMTGERREVHLTRYKPYYVNLQKISNNLPAPHMVYE